MTSARHRTGRLIALAATGFYGARMAVTYTPLVDWDARAPIVAVTWHGHLLPVTTASWAVAFLVSVLAAGCIAFDHSERRRRLAFWWAQVTTGALATLWAVAWMVGWVLRPGSLWWRTGVAYVSTALFCLAAIALDSCTPRKTGELQDLRDEHD